MPGRVAHGVFDTFLLALAGLVVAAALGPITGLWHYEVVESGSMTPALRIGGVAVVMPEPIKEVEVGQILALVPPGMKNFVRIHRVIALTRRDGQTWVRTKGDANNVADPGPIRLEGKTAYAEHAFVPYAGYVAVWLYKHPTRVALEVLLLALMVGGGLYLIWGGKEDGEEAHEVAHTTKRRWRPARPANHPALHDGCRHDGHGPAFKHKPAEQAAAASMASLNQIYAAVPEPVDQASGTASPRGRAAG